MLKGIETYVKHFTDVVAGVVGIDTEVVDANLVRVAGTGFNADNVGKNMETSGELYRHALVNRETVFVDDPRVNFLCRNCRDRSICQEKLTMCSPIVINGVAMGIIGLLCFNDADRDRVLANRDTYIHFVKQMADAIARAAQTEFDAKEARRRLDMLLKVTDSNTRCVLVLDRDNRIGFINDAARTELGLEDDTEGIGVRAAGTGEVYSDMEEFDLTIVRPGGSEGNETHHSVFGRLAPLDGKDPAFSRALVFDSKPRLAEMLSRIGGGSDNTNVLNSIIGESVVMQSLKHSVMRIAQTPSTVLITGESGTGKEMFARAIHAASPRANKPFVAINCGAIPDSLLESELFGYVRGAFTNASPTGRMGKFELADGGVLFLDEISAMPLYLQVKLLRVLQERRFNRLGSNKTVKVDLRIIAAANEKLPDLIAQKMFREDLYYRLNVIPLDLPTLRERKEDIPNLAAFFITRYCRLFGKPRAIVSDALLERLVGYHWPGNVREFENCIEYMVSMTEGGVLTPAALPAKILAVSQSARLSVRPQRQETGSSGDPSAVVPLATMEREAIRRALACFGDNVEGKRRAAKALGIGIATLYRKLKEL